MIIYLIRHGDNESLGKYLPGTRPGIHLNEAGRVQAQWVADGLANAGIQKIYASPLERTLETASPLAERLRLPIQKMPELMEMDAGDLTGEPFQELTGKEVWKKIRRDPVHHGYPHGEEFPAASERLWNCVLGIRAAHPEDGVVAVFSHADCIKMIITSAMQLPLEKFPRLSVDTATLAILGFRKETFWLGGMNIRPPYVLPPLSARDQHIISK
jgi:probable phosphoglycerate mutase